MTLRVLAAARTGRSGEILPEVLPWLLVLLALVVVGTIVLSVLRRRLGGSSGGHAGGFTLHDLRQLHAEGELSDEEFERAKAALISGVRGAASDHETTASGNPPEGPPSDPEDPNNPPSM